MYFPPSKDVLLKFFTLFLGKFHATYSITKNPAYRGIFLLSYSLNSYGFGVGVGFTGKLKSFTCVTSVTVLFALSHNPLTRTL